MAYYAIFELDSGNILKVIESPPFLVDRITFDEGQQIALLPHDIQDTQYKIQGDQLIKIES